MAHNEETCDKQASNCRGGQIRTDDLLVPNQARYRATLRPDPFKERKDTFSFQIHYPTTKILMAIYKKQIPG